MSDHLTPQAQQLYNLLETEQSLLLHLLSPKGKAAYFPKEGILAQTAQAKNKKYNATIGVALDDAKQPLYLSAIQQHIQLPPSDIYLYASSYGQPQLRTVWQQHIQTQNPSLHHSISLPIITAGLTHALSIIGHLFIDTDDIIITPDLYWGNYHLIFSQAHHAKFVTFPLFQDNKFNLTGFKQTLTQHPGKKIILLNFPNNPTGYTPTIEEAHAICEIIKQDAQQNNHLLVICDDAYFSFFYKQDTFKQSLFSLLANAHPNILTVKIDGASKELYAWGLRIAFLTYAGLQLSPATFEILEEKTAGSIRGNLSNASQLSQTLILNALQNPQTPKDQQHHFQLLQQRYTTIQKVLQNSKYQKHFTQLPCNSGYFLCIQLKQANAEPLRQLLLEKYDTGVIALKNLIRIAFSSIPEQDIPKIIENIYNACEELEENNL